MRERDQLDLFGAPGAEAPAEYPPHLRALSAALPTGIRLGTSSWTFPGWKGIVYRRRYRSQKQFLHESLAEYGRYPLFRTVGIDRSYYAPVAEEDFDHYRRQLPDGFECIGKVWSELTMRRFPNHPRYGDRAGLPNPEFLDSKVFERQVADPWLRGLRDRAGPLVVEVAPAPGPAESEAFVDRLDAFLGAASKHLKISVELREPGLLTEDYFAVLRSHRATHVFNHWGRMPTIGEQLELPGALVGPFVVARLLIPPGRDYEDQKVAFAPFDRIADPQPRMRREAVALMDVAVKSDYPIYMTVSNKVEGCSPRTVEALAEAYLSHHPAGESVRRVPSEDPDEIAR
ncbi:MAG: DUF72 domain-containing protein [Myxococcota bacterium]